MDASIVLVSRISPIVDIYWTEMIANPKKYCASTSSKCYLRILVILCMGTDLCTAWPILRVLGVGELP